MASYLKGVLIRSVAMVVSLWLPLSWGADSTAGPYGGSVVPTTSSNQPFLLDTGYADVRNLLGPWPAAGTYTTAGSVWTTGWTQAAVSGIPAAIRLTIFTNPHLCPINFNPVATVTPYKSLAQGNEAMRACADSLSQFDATRYWFGVWVNTVTDASGNYIPATSFYWSVYCYPSTTYSSTTISNPSSINANTGGACAPANANFAPAILSWSSGYVNGPAGASKTATFTLPRACPTNYTPYVVMHLANPNSPNSNWNLQGIGVCVTSAAGTTVNYYRVAKSNYDSLLYTKYETNMGGQTWASDVKGYFGLGSMVDLDTSARSGYHVMNGYDSSINYTNTDYTNYNSNDIFSYEMFCYPPGMATPGYSSNCNLSTAPFN